MTQTYQNTKSEKVDDLEAWLICRESKSNFQHISKMQFFKTAENTNSYTEVIFKIKKVFMYMWQWDI